MGASPAKALITASLLALCSASSAAAASTASSSNWSGYTAHRVGVRFTKVLGAWTQPKAVCSGGAATYSAMWVGLGGYAQSSNALEQIGTEVDCSGAGRVSSSAWYELVPAASQTIHMTVRPGDSMSASVSVSGNRVVLSLADATSHKSFRKVLHPSTVDVSSAEWILEAPSNCASANLCETLPLASFGSATFTGTRAESVSGHLGTISDRRWDATRILLRPSGQQFIGLSGSPGTATASALNARGTGFTLSYSSASAQVARAVASAVGVRAGQLVHPTR